MFSEKTSERGLMFRLSGFNELEMARGANQNSEEAEIILGSKLKVKLRVWSSQFRMRLQ